MRRVDAPIPSNKKTIFVVDNRLAIDDNRQGRKMINRGARILISDIPW